MAALTEAEDLVYKKLLEASEALSKSEAKLTEVLKRAQELPDGTKIFRGKDGNAFRSDGTQVPASEIADINWREDAATVDEHQQAKQAFDGDKARFDQLSGFEVELSEIRQKIKDKHNPATIEELDQFKDRIIEIRDQTTRSNNRDAKMEIATPNTQAVPDLALPPPS